jgi:hypothetical protein
VSTDREPRQLALALLRLHEAGDREGVKLLTESLDAEQARAVLLCQTENTSVLLEGLFVEIKESLLPMIVERFGRTRDQVVDDHLNLIIMRLALVEDE